MEIDNSPDPEATLLAEAKRLGTDKIDPFNFQTPEKFKGQNCPVPGCDDVLPTGRVVPKASYWRNRNGM